MTKSISGGLMNNKNPRLISLADNLISISSISGGSVRKPSVSEGSGGLARATKFVYTQQPAIFNKYINNNNKLIPFNVKNFEQSVGKTKYFPPVSKEWKNSICAFNPNNLKNLPAYDLNINSLIKKYFNLYFKQGFAFTPIFLMLLYPEDQKSSSSSATKKKSSKSLLRRMRMHVSMNKIYVSKAEIKHTNTKAILTVYTYNREKVSLLKRIKLLRKSFYDKINLLIDENLEMGWTNDKLMRANKYNKKVIASFLKDIILLRNYKLRLNLNKSKFEEKLLYKLNNLIIKFYNKKVEFNIVNLRSIILNSDIFTEILTLKLKDKKNHILKMMGFILNKVVLPKVNRITEKAHIVKKVDSNLLENKFKNLNIISILSSDSDSDSDSDSEATTTTTTTTTKFLSKSLPALRPSTNPEDSASPGQKVDNNLSEFLNKLYYNVRACALNNNLLKLSAHKARNVSNEENPSSTRVLNPSDRSAAAKQPHTRSEIYEIIFNSINYKNMGGVRLEVKGRLTKRNRADRALFKVKWKGGLKNIDSSYKGLSSVNMRGYAKPNVEYSIFTSKRRIGAFAVKGWISGK